MQNANKALPGFINKSGEHTACCIVQPTEQQEAQIALAASEMVRPLMEGIANLLNGNADSIRHLAEALDLQNERIASLERTIKRRMPVSSVQVRYMNEAIRDRVHGLLDGYSGIDGKAYTKLGRIIRRDVLVRCGAGSLRDVPDHEYSISMDQIRMWNNALVIRDVIREARVRAETLGTAEQPAGVDGA